MISDKKNCPACGQDDLYGFYSVENVPVNSCIMLDTAEDAFNYPRGDIYLKFCNQCCFIFNSLYDENLIEYSSRYEDQQSWSGTFSHFQKSLADDLVKRYGLYGKTILEIGCGKCDFLELLCRTGNNNGIGIDPAINTTRIPDSGKTNITFIPERYSENHLEIKKDFICCRHTLEHISDVGSFVKLVFDSIQDNPDVKIFFEVPDTTRIIENNCFQDIYYEHCSYFLPYSLSHLFSRQGFTVEKIFTGFDNQYLLLVASTDKKATVLPDANGKEYIKLYIKKFEKTVNSTINYWAGIIKEQRSKNKKIIIWGSGSKCISFLHTLKTDTDCIDIVDINPYRQGKYLPGSSKRVFAPDCIDFGSIDMVIVMNKMYLEEIREKTGNYSPDIKFLALD